MIIVVFILIAMKDEINDPNLGIILVLSLGISVNISFAGWIFAETGVFMSSAPRLLEYVDLPNEEKDV